MADLSNELSMMMTGSLHKLEKSMEKTSTALEGIATAMQDIQRIQERELQNRRKTNEEIEAARAEEEAAQAAYNKQYEEFSKLSANQQRKQLRAQIKKDKDLLAEKVLELEQRRAIGAITDEQLDQLKKEIAIQKQIVEAKEDQLETMDVFGKSIAKLSGQIAKVQSSKLGKLFSTFFGKLTAVLGGATLASSVLKILGESESAFVQIAKSTGNSVKASQSMKKEFMASQKNLHAMGISTQDQVGLVTSLTNQYGKFSAVNQASLDTAGLLMANFGMSGEEAVSTIKGMTKQLGMTVQEAKNFSSTMRNEATTAGVSASLVLRDVQSATERMDAALMMGPERLKQAAIRARQLGTSIEEAGSAAQNFEDLEGSLQIGAEAAVMFGSKFNAVEVTRMARMGDTEGVQKKMLEALRHQVDANGEIDDSEKGRRDTLIKMLGKDYKAIIKNDTLRLKLSKMGVKEESEIAAIQEEMAKTGMKISNINAGWLNDNKAAVESRIAELKASEDLEKSARENQTRMEKIGNAINAQIVPFVTRVLNGWDEVFKDVGGIERVIGKIGEVIGGMIPSVETVKSVFSAIKSLIEWIGENPYLASALGVAGAVLGAKGYAAGKNVVNKFLGKAEKAEGTKESPYFVKMSEGLEDFLSKNYLGESGGADVDVDERGKKNKNNVRPNNKSPKPDKGGKGIMKLLKNMPKVLSGSKGIVGGLLKKAPILGAGLNIASAGLALQARATAANEEEAKAANKELAYTTGGAAGSVIGGAIGTAILPGVGTVIGASLGSWLGGEGAAFVAENWDAVENFASDSWEGIKNLGGAAWDGIKIAGTAVFDAYVGMWSMFLDGLTSIWKSVISAINPANWFSDKECPPAPEGGGGGGSSSKVVESGQSQSSAAAGGGGGAESVAPAINQSLATLPVPASISEVDTDGKTAEQLAAEYGVDISKGGYGFSASEIKNMDPSKIKQWLVDKKVNTLDELGWTDKIALFAAAKAGDFNAYAMGKDISEKARKSDRKGEITSGPELYVAGEDGKELIVPYDKIMQGKSNSLNPGVAEDVQAAAGAIRGYSGGKRARRTGANISGQLGGEMAAQSFAKAPGDLTEKELRLAAAIDNTTAAQKELQDVADQIAADELDNQKQFNMDWTTALGEHLIAAESFIQENDALMDQLGGVGDFLQNNAKLMGDVGRFLVAKDKKEMAMTMALDALQNKIKSSFGEKGLIANEIISGLRDGMKPSHAFMSGIGNALTADRRAREQKQKEYEAARDKEAKLREAMKNQEITKEEDIQKKLSESMTDLERGILAGGDPSKTDSGPSTGQLMKEQVGNFALGVSDLMQSGKSFKDAAKQQIIAMAKQELLQRGMWMLFNAEKSLQAAKEAWELFKMAFESKKMVADNAEQITELPALISTIVGGLGALAGALASAAGAILGGLMTALGALWGGLMAAAGAIWSGLMTALTALIAPVWALIAPLWSVFWGVIAGLVPAIVALIAAIIAQIASMGPFALIGLAVLALIAVLILLVKFWKPIRKVLWGAIKIIVGVFVKAAKFVASIISKMVGIISKIAKKIFSLIPKPITNFIKKIGGLIFGFVKKLNPMNWFSEGGVVTKPTMSMVGETGEKEIIVPVDRIKNGGKVNPQMMSELKALAPHLGGNAGINTDSESKSMLSNLLGESTGGTSAGGDSALINEIKMLRQEIANIANRPIMVTLDGKQVSKSVGERFTEISNNI